jgi:hypothetical protein
MYQRMGYGQPGWCYKEGGTAEGGKEVEGVRVAGRWVGGLVRRVAAVLGLKSAGIPAV